ncbi:hypothetical protein [Methanococcus voltae]|uniref:Uncharacterized protein n=1 Tax=Methanococcus voltae PS TaxID=523842 RepID=A0ABT2EVM5_METVO|nr:hypothetical protein [Methanococcus voltae]MBP2173101.1 hypothetical protein [Methanococcus voltae]MCS3922008.1 hypothetical protein [Methanococcus voltae PS]
MADLDMVANNTVFLILQYSRGNDIELNIKALELAITSLLYIVQEKKKRLKTEYSEYYMRLMNTSDELYQLHNKIDKINLSTNFDLYHRYRSGQEVLGTEDYKLYKIKINKLNKINNRLYFLLLNIADEVAFEKQSFLDEH